MNKINNSISNNIVSITPPIIKNNRCNRAYAFSKKVVKHVPSTRNFLMLVSSTTAAAIHGSVSYQGVISDTSKNNSCNPNDAMFTGLLCGLNAILPTFLCMVLYAIVDAHDQKYNDTSVITTADKNDYEDIEKSMMNDQLIENKSLSRKLLTKIKLKLIDIKNKLKNIDKSEAFMYFLLMIFFMAAIALSEYSKLSDCYRSTAISSVIFVPILAFLIFSLPVMVIKKIEGMPID